MQTDNDTLSQNSSTQSTVHNSKQIIEFKTWDEINLRPELLHGIYSYGYEQPSPIQQKAIKPIIDKHDIIAQAQSGTGKTATFSIGLLQRINETINKTQAIVLSPTRELTTQTAKVIQSISSFIPNIRVKIEIGGNGNNDTIDTFVRNGFKNNVQHPHVICGCPGKICELFRRGKLNANDIQLVVFDEADEMFSNGFKDQMQQIFRCVNKDAQICLFSATLPDHVMEIAKNLMNNPIHICVKKEQLTLEGIKQYYVAVESDAQKYDTLKDLYASISMEQCIIYCNSVKRVQDLYDAMNGDEFPVCRIHSNMSHEDRSQAFNDFRTGKSRVLISSNVTARGIDIQQVSVVINFDLPRCVHTYLHRIGRSGRWGRKGVGINFITRRDIDNIRNIERHYATEITELPADFSGVICR